MTDAFDFLERSLHETKMDGYAAGFEGMPRTEDGRFLFVPEQVLELMAWAAKEARKVRKPGPARKKTEKAPDLPDQSPVVVRLPIAEDKFVAVHESRLPHLQKAYPALEIVAALHRVREFWENSPKNRPTERGWRRALLWQLERAQERATRGAFPNQAQGAGNQSGGSSYARRAAYEEEQAEQRRRQEAMKRGSKQERPSTSTIIDTLFDRHKR